MSASRTSQQLRRTLVLLMVALVMVPLASPRAVGEESMSELQARMEELQGELNAAQSEIEDLRSEQDLLTHRMEEARERVALLESRQVQLRRTVTRRARQLYMAGHSEMLEAFLGAKDIGVLMDRTEALSQVSMDDSGAFIRLARSQAELERLDRQMVVDRRRLTVAESRLARESAGLQERFKQVSLEYERLKAALARAEPAAPARPLAAPAASAPSSDGMTCPVDGAVSFTDTWGAPRAGHTHQGVDMMAAYGTPVVAITSGTITYAAYDGSGGNMIFLSGDDGHQYWYMHNQQNLVTGGHVSVGTRIATVGDTGNATGTPHVHFEYHPGGGAAINPYPLVDSLC